MNLNTPRKAAIVAVAATFTLAATPALASGATHPQRIIPSHTVAANQTNPYVAINAAAEQDPVTVTPLRGGVYLLQGSGGNIGVLPSDDGAFMVDAGLAVSRGKMESALQSIGATDVAELANTHWHFDHTDGNAWLHQQGAQIIATPGTLRDMSTSIRVWEWSHTFPPAPRDARPTVTISSETTYTVDGQAVQLRPYDPGHTDGDLAAYFAGSDVLFTGDTFWNGLYPFIDWETGGNIDGAIQQANKNIAMVSGDTIVVPGHGPVGDVADLVGFRDMLVGIRDRVAELKGEGLTVEQTIAAKPTQSFDAKFGQGLIGPDLFTELVYRGV